MMTEPQETVQLNKIVRLYRPLSGFKLQTLLANMTFIGHLSIRSCFRYNCYCFGQCSIARKLIFFSGQDFGLFLLLFQPLGRLKLPGVPEKSCARLTANVHGIKVSEDDMKSERVLSILQNTHIPEFVPKNKVVQVC